jgi:hypothetical protein
MRSLLLGESATSEHQQAIRAAIDAAEQRVRSGLSIDLMIYLEPALYDATQASPA